MKKRLLIASSLLFLLSLSFLGPAPLPCAEPQEIVAEGTYVMGDGETPIVAEGRAVEQAKRLAVEQAGTYVKSYSRVKNFEIAEDEIEVLASGMMEISVLDKKRSIEADAVKFWVKIKAIVKPDKIEIVAERVKSQGLGQEYEEIKKAYDKSQAEVIRLKEQLAAAKMEPERREIIGKIGLQEKEFQARQLYAEAMREFAADDTQKALTLLSQSIGRNPNFAPAHLFRGWIYYKREDFDKALPNFDKAVQLAPALFGAYAGRGMCHSRKNRFSAAIADLSKSLRLNSHPRADLKVGIHFHLGRSHLLGGDRQQARRHLQIACNLGNKDGCRLLTSPRLKNLP
ncbi:MAG: tetratricopeptide repeat protein [Syntrophales bacterium]|jgi:tetratricopeptide (TPR) repeat protein|nr:tetratricopeptide repeat protein [Syntrophales bacterium]